MRLSLTVENYLKEILLLQPAARAGVKAAVTTGRIAAALGVAPATVTSMLKSLEEAGLVRYQPYGGVHLTREGKALALRVQRRHRVVELFLVEVLGMPWTEVHEEAEALEHAVSDKVLERMDLMLGRPTVDPHGDPIPQPDGRVPRGRLVPLAAVPAGGSGEVVRLLDQAPEFLRFVEKLGLKPGSPVRVVERDESAQVVRISSSKGTAVVALAAAEKISVRPASGRRPGPVRRPGGRSGGERGGRRRIANRSGD